MGISDGFHVNGCPSNPNGGRFPIAGPPTTSGPPAQANWETKHRAGETPGQPALRIGRVNPEDSVKGEAVAKCKLHCELGLAHAAHSNRPNLVETDPTEVSNHLQ